MLFRSELLATEAHATIGVVPVSDATTCRTKAPVVDAAFVADVAEREKVTDHDVAAFVDVMQGRIGGSAAGWIHYGLTSTDVVDTALCWALRDASDLLIEASGKLLRVLVNLAKFHREYPHVTLEITSPGPVDTVDDSYDLTTVPSNVLLTFESGNGFPWSGTDDHGFTFTGFNLTGWWGVNYSNAAYIYNNQIGRAHV